MFHKALWLRNWKQSKYVVIAFWIAMFYTLPFHYLNKLWNAIYAATRYNQAIEYMNYFRAVEVSFAGTFILVVLAGVLIGRERTNKANDFHLSLPVSRKDIFLSKWIFGVSNIIAALTLNVFILVVLIQTTMIDMYERANHWLTFYVIAAVVFIAIFSLALFIGTITGHIVSQLVLSFVSLILVQGVTILTERAYLIIFNQFSYFRANDVYRFIVDSFTLPYILMDYEASYSDYNGFYVHGRAEDFSLLIPAVCLIIITIFLGMMLYARTKSENNGKALLFPMLHIPFIACTVICCALFGGYFLASLFTSTVAYYIGFVGAGIGTFFLLRRILTFKLKLQMR
jgi:acetoin utilization transport system permease protein